MQRPGAVPTADSSAKLVELGQAEAVGIEDDHQRGLRDVDPDFNHGRSNEDEGLSGAERAHGAPLLFGGEPPVNEPDTGLGWREVLREPPCQLDRACGVVAFLLPFPFLNARRDDERPLAAGASGADVVQDRRE